jgi:hypothetical protein
VKKSKKHKNIKSQIMKKAILTIGLFSLVMILTSFTTPETNSTAKSDTNVNIIGGGASGGNVKVDIIGGGASGKNVKVDIIGGGASGKNVKVDIIGGGASGGNVKVD